MKLARAGLVVLVTFVGGGRLLLAQVIARPVERVSADLQGESRLHLRAPIWTEPRPKTFGVLTLEPPTNRGEVVRIRIPIGEMVSRSAQGLARANRRRREASARVEVQAALTAFATQAKDP